MTTITPRRMWRVAAASVLVSFSLAAHAFYPSATTTSLRRRFSVVGSSSTRRAAASSAVVTNKSSFQKKRDLSLAAASNIAASVDDGSIATTSSSTTTRSDSFSTTTEETNEESNNKPRPFHQNWWPVTALNALDQTKPNHVQVLGLDLVVAWNKARATWTVLDDRCSHRFAPLSEGRLLHFHDHEDDDDDKGETKNSCLQCAYHGWEFNVDSGDCTRLPQQPDATHKARSVATYPAQERAGMLWVWTDPDSGIDLSSTVPLPVNPLLDRFVQVYGNDAVFMRDLPYGMELLGENLLDLAHLPYSHHSVGSLRRDLGGPLPTRMLTKAEQVERASWESEFVKNNTTTAHEAVPPTFMAEIVNASQHDPIFLGFPSSAVAGKTPREDWTCTISYYYPNHVRYRRWRGPGAAGHTELFLCPTSKGRSRVFLFNPNQAFLPSLNATTTQRSIRQRVTTSVLNPATWKFKLLSRMFDPRQAPSHMFMHSIFDGDGIFLHMQGNRMKQANLSFRDYSTPSSADVLLNAYRRYLETAATQTAAATSKLGRNDDLVQAVVGADAYTGDLPRSQMLDRYNTHTKHCPVCMAALKKARTKLSRLEVLQTCLQGAAGTSVATVLALTVLAVLKTTTSTTTTAAATTSVAVTSIPWAVWRVVTGSVLATVLGSVWTGRAGRKCQEQINKFLFEDYIHAEKD